MKTENSEDQSRPDVGRLEKIETILKDHSNLALILLVSITLLAGSYYLRLIPPDFNNGETVSWWGIATNLVRGYGYSLCNQYYFPFCTAASSATAMREPAPVLLFAVVAKLFNESLLAAGVTELILLIGVMVTLFFLTREWTGSTTAAFLSAIIFVLYPRTMPLISQVSGDLLAGLGVTFGILFTLRARKSDHIRDWLLAGLGLGIALMSRSAMLVVAVTVLAGLLVERWNLRKNFIQWTRPTLIIFAIVLVIMTPWLIRTKLVFGRALTGSSLVGYNIYRHNYMLGTNDYFHNVGNNESWDAIQALVARRTDLLGTENEAQMDLVYREEVLKIIAANPVHYVLLSGYRFFMLWFDWRVSEAFGYPMGPTEYATAFLQLLLLFLAIIASKNNLQKTWPLWASLAVVTLSYMAVNSRLHYLIPVMPLVISLSTAGLSKKFRP
ncbi:MAG: glycosyltransferase family 39 protein [Chloroflexi bacterium]|nr:glycosyltransferase family 39 protein [Chloroflexota bacterium]